MKIAQMGFGTLLKVIKGKRCSTCLLKTCSCVSKKVVKKAVQTKSVHTSPVVKEKGDKPPLTYVQKSVRGSVAVTPVNQSRKFGSLFGSPDIHQKKGETTHKILCKSYS
jgi:hypothetical protein